MSTLNTFQLSILSQNDFGAADGSNLICIVSEANGGTLQQGSFPLNAEILLPIPPAEGVTPLATPTWFLVPNGEIQDTSYTISISCPTDPSYPITNMTINASDVSKWASVLPFDQRPNQIYSNGVYGVFGFAQTGPDGLIYTVTAGVLNPQEYGN
ncbi:hypothetical protein ACLI1A_19410 [Flavobacterium sp. RHBU_3]|uniref:hypothetical protein n=1 Tax=Flavobacterium sp. RHBU_3 TaxID=3391184 RepID=UPI00398499FD